MSSAKVEPLKDHNSAEFLFIWVIANTVGLLVGRWFGGQIISVLWPAPPMPPNAFINVIFTNPIPRVIIVGLTTGTLLGILQWSVFRLFDYHVNWKWVVSSMLACVAFPTLGEIVYSSQQPQVATIVAILGGVTLGTVQWRILQQIVNRAGWWILATAVTGVFLFGSITPNPYNEPFALISGIIVGGITGAVLVLLLKHPVHQSEMSFQQGRG